MTQLPQSGASTARGLHDWCSLGVDAWLLSIYFIAPMFLGGRHPLGRLVLIFFISGALLTWLAEQLLKPNRERRWYPLKSAWMAIAAMAIVLLQIIPLSSSALLHLSPGFKELLPAWMGSEDTTRWQVLSLSPDATRSGLIMTSGYALFFLLVWQRMNTAEKAIRQLRWLMWSCVALGTFGLIQFVAGNGKFLWFYEHPTRDTIAVTKGPFQNQNHFGFMMAIGLSLLVWQACRGLKHWSDGRGFEGLNELAKKMTRMRSVSQHRLRQERDFDLGWLLPVFGCLLVGLAGFLTFSRGAMSGMIFVTVLGLALLTWAKMVSPTVLVGALGIGLLVAVMGASISRDHWRFRIIGSLNAKSISELSPSRFMLWKADWEAHQHFPWLGAGVGTHRYVYRTFQPQFEENDSAYAESSLMQLLLETGRLGILLVVVAGFLSIYSLSVCWRVGDLNIAGAAIACFVGLIATIPQAIADFAWHIPTCSIAVLTLLVVLWRLPDFAQGELSPPKQLVPSPAVWYGAAISIGVLLPGFVLGLWPEARAAGAWDQYLRVARQDFIAAEEGRIDGTRLSQTSHAQKAQLLEAALRSDPKNPRLHERLMILYLQSLEEKHGPIQLWAVILEGLASDQERESWKQSTFGGSLGQLKRIEWHAEQTLLASPLSGRAYCVKAELRRLRIGKADKQYHNLLKQAEVARPFDPFVLNSLGISASTETDLDRALRFWWRAAESDEGNRFQTAATIARIFPGPKVLEVVQPSYRVATWLEYVYRSSGDQDSMKHLNTYCIQSLKGRLKNETQPEERANTWKLLADLYTNIQSLEGCQKSLMQAVKLQPADFELRMRLADVAFRRQDFAVAFEHIRWCASRRPDEEPLQETMRQYSKLAGRASLDRR